MFTRRKYRKQYKNVSVVVMRVLVELLEIEIPFTLDGVHLLK